MLNLQVNIKVATQLELSVSGWRASRTDLEVSSAIGKNRGENRLRGIVRTSMTTFYPGDRRNIEKRDTEITIFEANLFQGCHAGEARDAGWMSNPLSPFLRTGQASWGEDAQVGPSILFAHDSIVVIPEHFGGNRWAVRKFRA